MGCGLIHLRVKELRGCDLPHRHVLDGLYRNSLGEDYENLGCGFTHS